MPTSSNKARKTTTTPSNVSNPTLTQNQLIDHRPHFLPPPPPSSYQALQPVVSSAQLQSLQPVPPQAPAPPQAFFPPPTTQPVCSVLLSDENFDPRFQVNVVAVVARDTIVPAHQSVTVDTNLVFNQINNFAVYFSALPVFLNVSNDVPYTPKNDYFLKPQNQMRLRVNLINASDTDFSLAESTTLGNVILFPYENFSQHYAN